MAPPFCLESEVSMWNLACISRHRSHKVLLLIAGLLLLGGQFGSGTIHY